MSIRLVRVFAHGLLFVFVGPVVMAILTAHMILDEVRCYRQYGKDWVAEYEKYHEPLARTNAKIAAGLFGLIAISVLGWWIYRLITAKNRKRVRRRHG